MAYADEVIYKELVGEAEAPEYLERKLEEASDMIDRVTYNRIRGRGFDNLSEYQQEMVRKAVCYQAKFLDEYGEYVNMPLSGYSAGSISLQFSKENMYNGEILDLKAIQFIKNSGLGTRRL